MATVRPSSSRENTDPVPDRLPDEKIVDEPELQGIGSAWSSM
jgi:hypothetical protein